MFRPSTSEPNLWKVLKVPVGQDHTELHELDSELYGLIVIYVDDLLILSLVVVIASIMKTI